MSLEKVFLFLLNNSVTALWAVLAVLVLRLLLRRAPRRIVCMLWALPGLRLLLPFSIESALSLIPSAETLPPEILYAPVPAIDSNIPIIDGAVNPMLETAFSPAAGASVNPMQLLMTGLGAAWLMGVAVMLALSLISALRLRKRVWDAVRCEDHIWRSDKVESPFVVGLLRPRIYLPFSLEGNALEQVLAHERAHIKSGDHWFKLIGWLLLSVYWFNPALWLAYVLFCRDMEMSCDERVIVGFDENEKRAYSLALLGCATGGGSLIMHPLAFGELGVKERIKKVLNFKRPAVIVTAVAVLLCVVAALCLLTNPKKSEPAQSEAPGVYLLIDREGVFQLEVSCGEAGISGGCVNADGTPFNQGELVKLEGLEGLEGEYMITVVLRDENGGYIADAFWEHTRVYPDERVELQWPPEDQPYAEVLDGFKELTGQERDKVADAARAELKKLYDIGLLSAELVLDGETTSVLQFEGDLPGDYDQRVIGPHYQVSNYWSKYAVTLKLDKDSGRIIYAHIEAVPDEGTEPANDKEFTWEGSDEVLRYYENFEDIIYEDMTLDRFCGLLGEYWGFGGYTLSGTVDAMYGYDTEVPDGSAALSEFINQPYLTVYFDGDQAGAPMYIELLDFPGRAGITLGIAHMVG